MLSNSTKNYKTSWTRHPKKDIFVVQGEWNAKIGEEACKDWKGTCGHHCNINSNGRGRQLLEFASYYDRVVSNTFGPTKHPEKSPGTVQTERHTTKLTTSWWRNDLKQVRTLPTPEACQESTLEATMSWSRAKKQSNTRIRFDLEKLKDPEVAEIFRAKIGALSIVD